MNIVPVMIAAQAAQQKEAERALLDAFRLADATAAERAQSLARLGIEQTAAFAKLEAAGVLRSAERGRYWLDERAVIAGRAAKPTGAPPRGLILVIGLLLLVGLAALGVLSDAG